MRESNSLDLGPKPSVQPMYQFPLSGFERPEKGDCLKLIIESTHRWLKYPFRLLSIFRRGYMKKPWSSIPGSNWWDLLGRQICYRYINAADLREAREVIGLSLLKEKIRKNKPNMVKGLYGAGYRIWTYSRLITNQLRYHCANPAEWRFQVLCAYNFLVSSRGFEPLNATVKRWWVKPLLQLDKGAAVFPACQLSRINIKVIWAKPLAEEEGFEPPWAFTQTAFKAASLWPLRYSSVRYFFWWG